MPKRKKSLVGGYLLAAALGVAPLLLLSHGLLSVEANALVASDSYARTVSTGWGTADIGGGWTILDGSSAWSVMPGKGSIAAPANTQQRGILESVTVQDVDLLTQVALPRCSNNCDAYVLGRVSSGSNPTYYRIGAVQNTSGGNVRIRAQRSDGSFLASDVNTSIPAADGVALWLRVQMQGISPTALRARAWLDGTNEPGTWSLNATDGAAAEQISGAVGVRTRNEDTSASHTFKYSSFQASLLPGPTPTPTPTSTPTPTPTPTSTPTATPAPAMYPPTGSQTNHYFYDFLAGVMHVYDIDNNFASVYNNNIPQTSDGVEGVVASPNDGSLYVAHGSNGGGKGSLLKYNLLTNAVVWDRLYSFAIDSPGITPDGTRIYMPTGENSGSSLWWVIDTSTGNPITSITAGQGPHNTLVSLNGQHVYMAGRGSKSDYLADTATNTVIGQIGPLAGAGGGRPFTINGTETYAFTTSEGAFGFQVSDIKTGKVMYTVPVTGFTNVGSRSIPDHGISLSPDEREIYLIDSANDYTHVFDVSGLPNAAPKQVADIKLSLPFSGNESSCPYNCQREGWMLHSSSGRYVFVGDTGDVIDTATRTLVANITTLQNTRKYIEIDWQSGQPAFTTNRYGLGYVTGSSPPPTPTPTPTPTPGSTPTPTPTAAPSLIAQDTFVRANQSHWGTASDGQIWGADAATNAAFSISNAGGTVSNGNASYSAILGPTATNAEVFFSGRMSAFSGTNIGALLRYRDGNDWYKAYINGTSLVVQKRVAGTYTNLASSAFTATANTPYSLRFRVVGATLVARVWATSSTEPAAWMLTVSDTSLASGYCGLRMLDQSGAIVTYTSFIATSIATLSGAFEPWPPRSISWTLVAAGLLVVAVLVRSARRGLIPSRSQ